jgi:hypothetical protein
MYCFLVNHAGEKIFASFDAIRAYYKFWGGEPEEVYFGKLDETGSFIPTCQVPLKDIWPLF